MKVKSKQVKSNEMQMKVTKYRYEVDIIKGQTQNLKMIWLKSDNYENVQMKDVNRNYDKM